ncbi:MAG: carbohydrate kinase family protein [Rhodanobacter sp.]
MSAVICGSLAYDTIMVFQDKFKNHILPDQTHILNVSFLVPQMRREFGGCAGNIAYNLKLLGGDPLPVAAVGRDFAPYRTHLEQCGIRLDRVLQLDDQFTPQGFITTDLDNNQITAFHPGAMSSAQQNHVSDIVDADLAIVAPDGREAMLQHIDEFAARGVPLIFDPGQAMPLFSGEEFRAMIGKSTYVIVNDYESRLLQTRTGWNADEIASRVSAYLITKGPGGSEIRAGRELFQIPAAREEAIVDPTGCGDAYRAGVIFGIMRGATWPTIGRMASLMGALKLASPGTQNQHFTYPDFAAQFHEQFGYGLG